MKRIPSRSEVEKAVIEYFKVCHKDLEPAAIEKEIEERMERLKSAPEKPAKVNRFKKYSQFRF